VQAPTKFELVINLKTAKALLLVDMAGPATGSIGDANDPVCDIDGMGTLFSSA
jgi:hypothetical protein